MLESLEIKNFQSNKDTKYDFVEGINVLTGSSNSGKTSALRALEFLSKNRPRGLPFRPRKPHETKKPTEVAATFDGVTATRIRSKSINQYTLSIVKDPFDVVGVNVPEEITQFLNLNDDTIQGQHDSYFLLQNVSPGEVAKKLNKVASLEIIDFVTKEVNSAITENTKDINITETTIKETKEQLKKYEHLDKAEELINTISDQLQKQQKAEEDSERLTSIITTIQETEEDIQGLEEWLEIEDEVLPIIEMVNELKNIQIEEKELQGTIDSIIQLEEDIQTLSAQAECEKEVDALLRYIKEYNGLVVDLRALQKLILNININTDIILEKEEEIAKLTEQAIALIQENEICPLCGGKVGKDAIEHLVGWL